MSFFKIFLEAVALASVLLLGGVNGCSCLAQYKDLCTYVGEADVALHATVLTKTEGVDINDDVTYTISPITFYKAELNVPYYQGVSFVTGGNSAACGVELEIGEEYLLGLDRVDSPFDTDGDGQLTVGLCGLAKEWDSVDDNELSCCNDPCDGACGEFQECSYFLFLGIYYCADSCDPSPCEEDEECFYSPIACIPEQLCPTPTVCVPTGLCSDICSETQECEYDISTEEYNCVDV